jgi:hypothetical protein
MESHDLRKFAYPIAVTFMYVLGGFIMNNWGGGAISFLTIPFYYIIADHLYRRSEATNPEQQTNDIYPH